MKAKLGGTSCRLWREPPYNLTVLGGILMDTKGSSCIPIVRDRFEGTQERILDESEIEDWAVAEVTAADPLVVLDLRTPGLLKLGVSTDAARAKEHCEGRKLSEVVYGSFAIDGLLYSSRLTVAACVAVYDRAVGVKLTASPAVELIRQADLVPALQSLSVSIGAGR